MRFTENINIGLRALRTNLLRSVLTLLIIAFGIMALVGILTAIDSVSASINNSFSGLGANSFKIERKAKQMRGRRRGREEKQGNPIVYQQAIRFKEKYDYPSKVSLSTICMSNALARFGSKKTNNDLSLVGIDEQFVDINGYKLRAGRLFSATELENALPKAIVSQSVVEALFAGNNEKAMAASITIDDKKYNIVGILADKGSSANVTSNNLALIPLATAKRLYDYDKKEYDINVTVKNTNRLEDAMAAATGVFRRVRALRHYQNDDFELTRSDNLVTLINDNTATLRYASMFIGFVTLLGAAIGLMNIMLVSVTERTREIGICKAVGATRSNIMLQYLIEAVIISQLGGVVGIFLGILIGNSISLFTGGVFVVPWQSMFIGVFVCFVTGVVAGLYPAVRAANLDPIESLRYE